MNNGHIGGAVCKAARAENNSNMLLHLASNSVGKSGVNFLKQFLSDLQQYLLTYIIIY